MLRQALTASFRMVAPSARMGKLYGGPFRAEAEWYCCRLSYGNASKNGAKTTDDTITPHLELSSAQRCEANVDFIVPMVMCAAVAGWTKRDKHMADALNSGRFRHHFDNKVKPEPFPRTDRLTPKTITDFFGCDVDEARISLVIEYEAHTAA